MGLDPVEVDSKHYTVEFENEHVRVLRITYGPKEMSEMHEHPNGVGVFLTSGKARFHLEDGTSEEISWKAGDAAWFPAGKHNPENLGDEPIELIEVELKP
ncbi:MAG: cupin domain-containing protein [candidate division NC10 bacterium]